MRKMSARVRYWRNVMLFCAMIIAGLALVGVVASRTFHRKWDEKERALRQYRLLQWHPPASKLTPQDTASIGTFLRWVDSVKRAPAGQGMYDSFCRAHPGLLDSVRAVK